MSGISTHHSINYIELPSIDLETTKAFYGSVFGWGFIDYGPTYVAITGAGIDGGFELNPEGRTPSTDGALVILASDDLEASQAAVEAAGGAISVSAFDFPGGRRFHFSDPSGNELAIWTPA